MSATGEHRAMTEYPNPDAWQDMARSLFGDDPKNWRFVCPICEHVATPGDFKALGAEGHRAAHECIGRVMPRDEVRKAFGGDGPGPCDYAAFGLFDITTVHVKRPRTGKLTAVFEFAPVEADESQEAER